MNRIAHRFIAGVFSASMALVVESGCVSTRKAATPEPGARILSSDDYEYVTVTGSAIPLRVPKDKTVRSLETSGGVVSTESLDQFAAMTQRGETVKVPAGVRR